MFDPARLQIQLLNLGLQNKDNPHYQLLFQIINALRQLQAEIDSLSSGGSSGGGGSSTIIQKKTVIIQQTIQELLNNISIQQGDASSSVFVEWSVLTNGDPINPELIFDAFGDVIMTHIP